MAIVNRGKNTWSHILLYLNIKYTNPKYETAKLRLKSKPLIEDNFFSFLLNKTPNIKITIQL